MSLAPMPITERLEPLERIRRYGPLVVVGLGLTAIFSDDEGTVLCPFRRTTEGYCPLCGGTRAAGSLLRGDVGSSLSAHPAVVLLAVQVPLFVWFLATGLGTVGRRRWFQRIVAANVVMVLVVWLVRLGLDDVPRPSTLTWPL